ncbi:hypothetical protein CKY51_11580 [Xanthomonas maliensis]|nr:hypothetical protein CKY51_11580 [Xanthomonas maliensis]
MAVKYTAGYLFAIPLGTGTYALCQVMWAPQGDYRKVFAFCVLEQHVPTPERSALPAQPLPLPDGDKDIRVVFTATKSLKNGEWPIIGHEALSSAARQLRCFHIAGALHEGDTFIRVLSVEEYARYPAMSVFGFELVQRLLMQRRG